MKYPKCLNAAIALVAIFSTLYANAKDVKVTSPDGKISVLITDAGDSLSYSASLDGENCSLKQLLWSSCKTNPLAPKPR